MNTFQAEIAIIGINPFVFVPDDSLEEVFEQAGRRKGPIPVGGTINGELYSQTLVKYSGEWRLYINTTMLKDSPKRIGEVVELTISYDSTSRDIAPPDSFLEALAENETAKHVFDHLPASRKMEIVRYLARLKTPVTLEKNVKRAVNFLVGNERFIGRDKP